MQPFQAHSGIKGFTLGYRNSEVVPLSDSFILAMNITDKKNPQIIDHAIFSSKLEVITHRKLFNTTIGFGDLLMWILGPKFCLPCVTISGLEHSFFTGI